MKKYLSLFLTVITVSVFATQAFPKASKDKINLVKNPVGRQYVTFITQLESGSISSQMAILKQKCETAKIAYNEHQLKRILLLFYVTKGGITENNKAEVFAAVKQFNSPKLTYNMYRLYPKFFTLSNKEKEELLFAIFTSKAFNKNIKFISTNIDEYLVLITELDNKVAKQRLMKLNKLYSTKLIENKQKWEPIIAKIRTALETY